MRPVTVNLAPNPGFRTVGSRKRIEIDGVGLDVDVFDQDYQAGGSYVHVHNVGYATRVPGRPDTAGILVRGIDASNDTHIAPGGRDAKGKFRLGMRAGRSYTAEVSVYLDRPLTGHLHRNALQIVIGVLEGSTIRWNIAQSHAARNEHGDHRIWVTYSIPKTATAAFIRLVSGMSAGNGEVIWHSLTLTESAVPVGYFDGDTPDDDFCRYEWVGAPNASRSRRVLRSAEEFGRLPRTEVAERAVSEAAAGRAVEAHALINAVPRPERDALRVRAESARLAATGDSQAATALLREAAGNEDVGGNVAFDMGRLLLDGGNAAAAEPWLRDALAARPDSSVRAYQLSAALERMGQRAESGRIALDGLANDQNLPFDPGILVAVETKAVGTRREIGVFLAAHLDQIRAQARQRLAEASEPDHVPIFVYWGQGFAAAPPVVRRCVASLHAHNPNAHIHELTDDLIRYWVDLPEDLVSAVGENRTHMSDLLRLALLERHGGIWVDATCLVTAPLEPQVDKLLANSDIFAFSYAGRFISSWFLASRPRSYAMHLWRAAMFLWWELRGELIDYFLLHHFFEMLYNLDEDFRAAWDSGTRLSARPPHDLQKAMLEPYDADRFADLLAGSFIHKLRHKIDARDVRSNSFLAHLVRHGGGI